MIFLVYTDVPVHGIDLTGVESVKEGTINNMNVDLQVAMHRDAISAWGSDLWKLGTWASPNHDGSGDKIGFREQVGLRHVLNLWNINSHGMLT